MEVNQEIEISRPVIEISQEGNIWFTKDFMQQMKYLCEAISVVEWSGLVFYKVEGNMQNLEKFTVTPYYIHLMHKGTHTYTEFDDDGSLKELYKAMPELDPFEGDNTYLYGKIHSHNSMGVFHSPTDHQDLQDQAGKFNPYYLSIIVNNRMDLEAKIAFVAEIPQQKIQPTKFKGEKGWFLEKREVLGIVDLDVETEEEIFQVGDLFEDRVSHVIKEANKPPVNPYKHNVGKHNGKQFGFPINKHLGAHQDDIEEAEELDEEELAELALIQDFIDPNDFMGNDTNDEILDVRFNYGRKSITAYINTVFKTEIDNSTLAGKYVEGMDDDELPALIDTIPEWFSALSQWQQQNVIIYVTDESTKGVGPNMDKMFETIYQLIKVKTV